MLLSLCIGYVSHCGSDSDDSDTDVDALLAHVASTAKSNNTAIKHSDKLQKETEKALSYLEKDEEVKKEGGKEEEVVEKKEREEDKETILESIYGNNGKPLERDNERVGTEKESKEQEKKPQQPQCVIIVEDPSSEASDSYQTESHFLTSISSDSIDALEEDDLMTYFSTRRPCHLPVKDSYCCEDRYSPSLSPQQLHNKDYHPQSDLCSADSHCEPDIDQFFAVLHSQILLNVYLVPLQPVKRRIVRNWEQRMKNMKRGHLQNVLGAAYLLLETMCSHLNKETPDIITISAPMLPLTVPRAFHNLSLLQVL